MAMTTMTPRHSVHRPKLTYRTSSVVMDMGETESIISVGTDQSHISESTKASSALSSGSKPHEDAKDAEAKSEKPKTESTTPSRSPSTYSKPVSAKPKSAKKKGSSIMGFFTTKEPSAAALASFEEYTRKQAAPAGRGQRPNAATLSGVSMAKMPANVPPVNSKWDGIPRALKEKEKSNARNRNTFSQQSMTRSRTKSGSRPSTAGSKTSNRTHRASQSRDVTSSETINIPSTSSTPSSIQTVVEVSKTAEVLPQPQQPTPQASPTIANRKSLEQLAAQIPESAVVYTQIHRNSYFPLDAVASGLLRRNSIDSIANHRDSISLLIDEFPPTPMGPGGLASVQPQRRRNNSLASPPPTPPAVSEDLPARHQSSGTSSRPGTAKKASKKVEVSIFPFPDRSMAGPPRSIQQLQAKRSLQNMSSHSSRRASHSTHNTSISSTTSSLSNRQRPRPSKPKDKPPTDSLEKESDGLGLGLATLDTNRIFVNAEAEQPRRETSTAPWDEPEQVIPPEYPAPLRPRSKGESKRRRASVVTR